jgi:DNA-binding IclR family transcriptional regulator
MAAKTYNPVQSNYKFIDIIEYILQQTAPVSGTQIAKALDMAHGTVMSHLQPMVERKWVKLVGEQFEPGLRLMGMYSAYKMGLIDQRDALDKKIELLEA